MFLSLRREQWKIPINPLVCRRWTIPDGFLLGLTEQLGCIVLSTIFRLLVFLDDIRMRFGVRVISISSDLPTDFDIWLVRFDGELVVVDFSADSGLGELFTDYC